MILKPLEGLVVPLRMNRRDIIIALAVLLLTIVATWAGTDYVVNQVVLPLIEDEPGPGSPAP
jgi:hypothetical protein